MFIVDSYTTSVLFCLLTMLCWGSWANTQKLTAGQWRFELFYWDYVIGIVLFSFLLAFTLGSNGTEGRSFLADWQQASMDNIMLAVLGGIMFNAANILLVAAIAIAGMSVAFPVGIGLALVIGVIVNYVEAPVGNAALVFGGVLLIVAAILLNAFAYRKLVTHVAGASTRGIVLSVVSGFQMGLFYRSVAISMFPDFNVPEAGKLSPYTAVVFFSLGIVLSNLLFNTLMMKFPFTGAPVRFADYFSGTLRNHLIGVLGGLIWCVGMSFNILASGKAGPAISYGLGQGATVIAALWGIFIWKEFKGAPPGTNKLLVLMLLCYVAGLAVIIAAR